jgi:hypothetical protein
MSHARGTGDLAQITFGVGPVLHHRRPADDCELSNLGQTMENLVLDTVGKVGVVLIGAEALEKEEPRYSFRHASLPDLARLNKIHGYRKSKTSRAVIQSSSSQTPSATERRCLPDFLCVSLGRSNG